MLIASSNELLTTFNDDHTTQELSDHTGRVGVLVTMFRSRHDTYLRAAAGDRRSRLGGAERARCLHSGLREGQGEKGSFPGWLIEYQLANRCPSVMPSIAANEGCGEQLFLLTISVQGLIKIQTL